MENIQLSYTEKNNKSVIPVEISNRITSLRFLLTVFVVFIHSHLKPEEAVDYFQYDFIQPVWIEIFKDFICTTLGGAAVPLFFFFASFLQFSKETNYLSLLKKKAKTILLPYILWTLLTVFLMFIAQSIPFTSSFFQNPINLVKNWSFLDWVKVFTYHINGFPLVSQFWFLRELMIFIVLSPVLKKICTPNFEFFNKK